MKLIESKSICSSQMPIIILKLIVILKVITSVPNLFFVELCQIFEDSGNLLKECATIALNSFCNRLGFWLIPPYSLAAIKIHQVFARSILDSISNKTDSIQSWNFFGLFDSHEIVLDLIDYGNGKNYNLCESLKNWWNINYLNLIPYNCAAERAFSIYGRFVHNHPNSSIELASSFIRNKLNNTNLSEEDILALGILATAIVKENKVSISNTKMDINDIMKDLNTLDEVLKYLIN